MVEQHQGTIRVESVEGHGSRFIVRLARLPAHATVAVEDSPLDPKAALAMADEIRVAPVVSENGAPVREDGPLVLVVDDHPDVREYVARHLRKRYRVVTAGDGVEALSAMREETPDLVVSDVTMPHLDGYGLVSAIRRDPEFDYVPVILLTAAASPDHRVAGLEGGADDYLTKPFEMRELIARVAQALESRRRLRDRIARAAAAASVYGASPAEEPAPIASLPSRASAVDNAFVRRIREVIEARMGDEDFEVDRRAEAMGMSRTLFYEKVAELMKQTPMALVTTYRLERAAELLRAGEGNVSEVAYAVGFRSVAHFSRRFREHHGVTPSSYRRAG
jgi:CheY-like chemotaxis protein